MIDPEKAKLNKFFAQGWWAANHSLIFLVASSLKHSHSHARSSCLRVHFYFVAFFPSPHFSRHSCFDSFHHVHSVLNSSFSKPGFHFVCMQLPFFIFFYLKFSLKSQQHKEFSAHTSLLIIYMCRLVRSNAISLCKLYVVKRMSWATGKKSSATFKNHFVCWYMRLSMCHPKTVQNMLYNLKMVPLAMMLSICFSFPFR